jgi:hypothetical protein
MHEVIIAGLLLAIAACLWILFHIQSDPVDHRKEVNKNHDYEG